MCAIILLMLLGMFLLLVELILLPGISLAAIGAAISYVIAVYKAYALYGTAGLVVGSVAVLLSVVVTLIFCVKTKAWNKLTLKDNIESKSQQSPQEENVTVGDEGITVTRLAPMGKVMINGKIFEAKSLDSYVDPKTKIRVMGFENFSVIVERIDN